MKTSFNNLTDIKNIEKGDLIYVLLGRILKCWDSDDIQNITVSELKIFCVNNNCSIGILNTVSELVKTMFFKDKNSWLQSWNSHKRCFYTTKFRYYGFIY